MMLPRERPVMVVVVGGGGGSVFKVACQRLHRNIRAGVSVKVP